MTPRQAEAFNFIRARLDSTGVSPSMRELAAALRMKSHSGAHRLIAALERDGHLRRSAFHARTIEVVRHVCCPACGESFVPGEPLRLVRAA